VIEAATAEDMRQAMHAAVADMDPHVVVMAAAVADFRPTREAGGKITKDSLGDDPTAVPEVLLERTTDVLAELVSKRGSAPGPILVGFAAEAPGEGETLRDRAMAKLQRKGCDVVVANAITDGAVFGQDTTTALIVGANGTTTEVADTSKAQAAHALWDTLSSLIAAHR
jgi:phosphopantothenoylcysteine decarboxylase/phosphopantothenate--cysteine ligase